MRMMCNIGNVWKWNDWQKNGMHGGSPKTGGLRKGNPEGRKGHAGRYALYAASAVLMFLLTACGSKETVLLEEEDLVRTAGDYGAETAPGSRRAETAKTEEGSRGQQEEALPGEASGAEAGGQAVENRPEESQAAGQAQAPSLFVHICGEVKNPGVYELPAGSRIFEAVEAAGGFTEEAWESYVNLALELTDGWKVEIPALAEAAAAEEASAAAEPEGRSTEGEMSPPGTDARSFAAGMGGTAENGEGKAGNKAGITQNMAGITGKAKGAGEAAETGESTGGLVNINTASKQELCSLTGIGESRAESIISYREKNGGFQKIEDIMKVDGIKEGMFSRIKDKICVRGVE